MVDRIEGYEDELAIQGSLFPMSDVELRVGYEGMDIVSTAAITIQVNPEAAKAFEESAQDEQRKIQLLLSLRLQEITTLQGKSLQTVMDEIGARAEERGLTPEILKSLLDDQ